MKRGRKPVSKKRKAPQTTTANGALAFASTGNLCLDLFTLGIGRGVAYDRTEALVQRAFDVDPITCVKILLYSRHCREAGKGERTSSLNGWLALRSFKPRTYLANLAKLVEVGSFRDLPLLETLRQTQGRPLLGEEKQTVSAEMAMLAKQLKSDLDKCLAFNEANKGLGVEEKAAPVEISLAGKWAPSESASHRKMARSLAKYMFAQSPTPSKEYRQMLNQLREQLRVVERRMSARQYSRINYEAVPSRAMFKYKSSFQQHDQQRFLKFLAKVQIGKKGIKFEGMHPHELVMFYLKQMPDVDAVVELQWSAALNELKKNEKVVQGLARTVSVVDVSGSMQNPDCIPLSASIAMGLIVSQISKGPYRECMITFHESPSLVRYDSTKSFFDQVKAAMAIPWGGSTDLYLVFKLLLSEAAESKVAPQDFPDQIFIFTDGQFDTMTRHDASLHKKTVWEAIKDLFAKYPAYSRPRVIFWNLNARYENQPVRFDENNVALLSGFNPALMKAIFAADEPPQVVEEAPAVEEKQPKAAKKVKEAAPVKEIDPVQVMMKAIEQYQVIIDPDEVPMGFSKKPA